MRGYFKILIVLAVISAVLALSLIAYDYIITRWAMPPNTFVGGVDVSRLSYAEAAAKLKAHSAAELFSPLITLEAGDVRYTFAPNKLGVYVRAEDSIKNAFRLIHKGGYFFGLRERLTTEATSAPLVLGLEEEQLRAVLEAIAGETNTTSKDAAIIFIEKTGGYNIKPEIVGKELSVEQNVKVFKSCLHSGKAVVPLLIRYALPRITETELRAHPPVYRLSAYTTYYGKHDSPNRIHNIRLVSSWIDGTLLMPGETFSAAEILGDVTEEQGFKEAFVIIKGELVPLLGGGSCQIATTLYNAASLADLKIAERRNHSFYFNIYPLGRDAAVYPGQIDFKFENDTPYPILIKSEATDRRLSFRIYGTPAGRRVNFSSAKVLGRSESGRYIPMSLEEVIANDIPFKTEIKRTVYEKRKKIGESFVRSSYKLYGDKENVPIRRPEPR